MVALRRRLEALPIDQRARSHPRNWYLRIKRGMDFMGHARPGAARFFARANPYPKPFRHVRFRTEDGVSIAGWLGPPHDDAPLPPPFGLVIAPGMFSTKDDTLHKRRAIRLWRTWKIPVLVIDLRAFGESNGIGTGGWKEALDIHGAARLLQRETGVHRIGVLAESMGGAGALNALAHDSQSGTELFAGGVLTWSAFIDTEDAVQYISEQPPQDHPFLWKWRGFRRMLMMRSMGGYERFDEYLADAARVNGLANIQELYELANPKWKVALMHQPVLCVHATDDPIVPVRHARRMERYARDHPHIQTLIVPFGGHTAFEYEDPWWFWEVARQFYGTVNGVKLPNPEGTREARRQEEPKPPKGKNPTRAP